MYSIENISYQKDNPAKDLAAIIDKHRELGRKNFKPLFDDIGNYLTKRFGLNVDVSGIQADFINACAYFKFPAASTPLIGKNMEGMYKKLADEPSVIAGGLKNSVVINIDNNKAYISGDTKMCPCAIALTTGLMHHKNDSLGIAAIILHEMGHLFTFFSYATHTTHMLAIASLRSKDLLGKTPVEKLKALGGDDELNLTQEELESIKNCETRDATTTILIKSQIREYDTQLGMTFYSNRVAEQQADSFAIRCGAGKEFSDIMTKMVMVDGGYTFGSYIAGNIAYTMLSILTAGLLPIATVIAANFLYTGEMYDEFQNRLIFMMRERINLLKTVDDPKAVTSLLADIEAMKANARKIKPIYDKGVEYLLMCLFVPKFRKAKKETEIMKELEALIDNDLYVHAASLRQRV